MSYSDDFKSATVGGGHMNRCDLVEVKTEALIGRALDWAVCKAAYNCEPYQLKDEVLGTWYAGEYSGGLCDWEPSLNWEQCGPLLERFKLEPVREWAEEYRCVSEWDYNRELITPEAYWPSGETALVAICRAVVAMNMGDVVKVPVGLIGGVA